MQSEGGHRQETQIVQSQLTLDDFLPGITRSVLCCALPSHLPRGSLRASNPVREGHWYIREGRVRPEPKGFCRGQCHRDTARLGPACAGRDAGDQPPLRYP